jgi:hypothetical protein
MSDAYSVADRLWDALRRYRDAEVERIEQQIQARRLVGLEGEVGVGKSMLLSRLQGRRNHVGAFPAVVNLDGAWGIGRTAWLFFYAAAAAISGPAMSHLVALDESLMPSGSRSAGVMIHNLFGSEITDAVLHGSTLPDDDDLLTQAIEVYGALTDVLLIIDHLDAPKRSARHPLDVDQLLWQIRGVHQRNRGLRLCLCGRPDAARAAHGKDGAFYDDGIWITVSPPARDVWLRVAADAWPQLNRPAIVGRVEAILKVTDRQPASTVAMFAQDPRPSVLDAEQAAARAFERAADIALAQARSVHRLGAHLLLELAQRQGPYAAVPGGRTEVTRALRALRTAGLVTRHGRGDWRLTEPLLGAALVLPQHRELGALTEDDELPEWEIDQLGTPVSDEA